MSLVKFSARTHPQQGYNEEVNDRATTHEDFAVWHERFRFTVDAAASPGNTKLARYWTRADDGLAQSWGGERVWCNPPYSAIYPWVEKAWAEAEAAELIVMLLPAARTEQAWWQDLIEPCRDRPGSPLAVEFLRGRLRFIAANDTQIRPNARPPFGCCLVIWNGERSAVEMVQQGRLV